MIIRFTPEADDELAEARQWYARQRESLDAEFMQSIDEALTRVSYQSEPVPNRLPNPEACCCSSFPVRDLLRVYDRRNSGDGCFSFTS